MMWQEFERLAGYEVSFEDYTNVIEPMYMATNLSKQDFIKCLNRKQFDINYKKAETKKRLVKEMKELAEEMHDLCGRTDTYEVYEALVKKAREYIKVFPMIGSNHEFETAKGYGNCTYVKALVYYDKDWNEAERIELVA